ncbi:MAG: hypothetical protein NW201_11025 [Gemmatimonadales bacterium]|nr:hypothetical protein [Gemmatimonadales bacterium]
MPSTRDTPPLGNPPATDQDDGLSPRERARLADREAARRVRRGAVNGPNGPAGPARPAFVPADGGFEVSVETDAVEYRVDEDGVGESIFLRITSARDGFLTLLSGGTGPGYTVLVPSTTIAQLPVRAGQPLQFPLPGLFWQGIELKPRLLPGQEQAQQSLIAVVTARPVPLPLFDPVAPVADPNDPTLSLRLFQNWLGRIPVADRGVGQAFYLVTRQ